jgi:charged multivesicular body protein 2B
MSSSSSWLPTVFKKETPKEAANKAKRTAVREVRSNQRDLDREVRELDRQEKSITAELKARAKVATGTKDPALTALAKQLVQVRQQRTKLQTTKAQLGAMGMHATVTASHIAAVSAIGSVTGAMKTANAQVNMKDTMKVMSEFQRENERIQVKEEMMDDALADAFDSEGVEEEAENVTNQVLAELGVELDSQMVGLNAPSNKLSSNAENALSQEEQDALDDVLPDLRARLNAL